MSTLIADIGDIHGTSFSGEFRSAHLGRLLEAIGRIIGTDLVPVGVDITIQYDINTEEWVLYIDAED